MSTLATVYATDEDIAIRAAADFPILCPKDQKVASGSDGAFSPSAPWTLTSGALDFSVIGLTAGQLVQLLRTGSGLGPPAEALVVVSVSPYAVTLRRKGLPVGVGQPPGPSTVLTGVVFSITTLGPQIERASYDLNRRYGIDTLVAGRRPGDLYDPREIREATVLTVLYRQYLAMSREAGEKADTFAAKAAMIKEELDDLLSRIVVHWGPPGAPIVAEDSTSRFGARLVR